MNCEAIVLQGSIIALDAFGRMLYGPSKGTPAGHTIGCRHCTEDFTFLYGAPQDQVRACFDAMRFHMKREHSLRWGAHLRRWL